jgi:hypothetical protein
MRLEKGLQIVGALALGTLTLRAIRLVVVWLVLRVLPTRVKQFKGDWALITGGVKLCNHPHFFQLRSHAASHKLWLADQ